MQIAFHESNLVEELRGRYLARCHEPAHRLEEVVVHDGVPFITFKEVERRMPHFRSDDRFGVGVAHSAAQTLPENMVDFVTHVHAPTIHAGL